MFSLYGRWRLQDMSLEFCLRGVGCRLSLQHSVDKRVTRSWCQRRGIDSDFWLDSVYISAISRVLEVVQVMSIHLTGCQLASTSKGNERWMVDNRMRDKCCYWRLSFSILPFSLSISQRVPSKWHSCKLKSFSVCVCVCWCTEDIITGNINVRSVMFRSKTNKSNVFKFIPEDRKVGSCRRE